jgi:competence protein ComFC
MGNGIIKYLIDSVLSVVYAREDTCLICNICSQDEELICNNCLKKIQFYNDSFKIKKENLELECFSAAYYSSIVRELIRRLKYKGDFYAGELLASFLINLIRIKTIKFDYITFVPMSKKAINTRGFNQSKFLAKLVSESFNVPLKELLIKIRETKDQIGLDGESRWDNLNNCFIVKDSNLIKNKKILLVDDVLTTGATAFYSSAELIKNGAEKVTVLTVAKSKL